MRERRRINKRYMGNTYFGDCSAILNHVIIVADQLTIGGHFYILLERDRDREIINKYKIYMGNR